MTVSLGIDLGKHCAFTLLSFKIKPQVIFTGQAVFSLETNMLPFEAYAKEVMKIQKPDVIIFEHGFGKSKSGQDGLQSLGFLSSLFKEHNLMQATARECRQSFMVPCKEMVAEFLKMHGLWKRIMTNHMCDATLVAFYGASMLEDQQR